MAGIMPRVRQIQRILVANRGEIAIRILQSCFELPDRPITYAIYTDSDSTHVSLGRPDHALKLSSPAAYMDVDYLISLAKQNNIDAVHPGYGFLSESAEFSRRMWEEAGVLVVGPGADVLDRTGDKLKAKSLAKECDVPVLTAMSRPTARVDDVMKFAGRVGFPIMIKAVDGGGGRGIRLVQSQEDLQNAVERCINESPSRLVFAEQAAVDGFKHIEIQIVGDGRGGVCHRWERDCSIQRRFQKIVEVAPAPVSKRDVIAKVIDSAVSMAQQLRYLGLGTWEFLVNVEREQFFFLEINPRLQVEHTITECICGIDLVRQQLLLAQGKEDLDAASVEGARGSATPPKAASIQLRLCAEDPNANFALSIGKVTDVQFPSGNGVRVDSHLSHGGIVGSDFDNLMAKVIVTASSWHECVIKAQRALAQTKLTGVRTNLNLLRAIVAEAEFEAGHADTKWLERNMQRLITTGERIGQDLDRTSSGLPPLPTATGPSSNMTSTATMLRKGDAWSISLESASESKQPTTNTSPSHIMIDKVSRNEFPEALIVDISYTQPGSQPAPYKMTLVSTNASSGAASSSHRRGDPNNKRHIVLPMNGKLVEVLVEEGDTVQENQVIGFVKQMKMEIEIRSPRAGLVAWALELDDEDGDEVAAGVLLVELGEEQAPSSRSAPDIRSRL